MIHELKEKTEYFDKVVSGEKTFEVRANDREYNVGDYLALNEYLTDDEGAALCYGERCCIVRVTDILRNPEFVKEGYVIMSICPCRIDEHRHLPVAVYGTEGGSDDN